MENILICDNINAGIKINNLFNQWNNVKSESEYKQFEVDLKKEKFGTYGTISIIDVMENFVLTFPNQWTKESFLNEINQILSK